MHSTWPLRLLAAAPCAVDEKHRDRKVTVSVSLTAGWCCLQASPASSQHVIPAEPQKQLQTLRLIVSSVDNCTESHFKGFKLVSVLASGLYPSLCPAACSVYCKCLSACSCICTSVLKLKSLFLSGVLCMLSHKCVCLHGCDVIRAFRH